MRSTETRDTIILITVVLLFYIKSCSILLEADLGDDAGDVCVKIVVCIISFACVLICVGLVCGRLDHLNARHEKANLQKVTKRIELKPSPPLGLRRLWRKKKKRYSDLTLFLANGIKLRVHQKVLLEIDFFRAACSGPFKVDEARQVMVPDADHRQEASTRSIHFPEDDPDAMTVLVQYMYDYTVGECIHAVYGHPPPIFTAVKVLEVAKKYHTPDLILDIMQWLREQLPHEDWCCIYDDDDGKSGYFWSIVPQLYTSDEDAPELRRIMMAMVQYVSGYTEDEEDKLMIRRGLEQVPELAIDLALDCLGLRGGGCAPPFGQPLRKAGKHAITQLNLEIAPDTL